MAIIPINNLYLDDVKFARTAITFGTYQDVEALFKDFAGKSTAIKASITAQRWAPPPKPPASRGRFTEIGQKLRRVIQEAKRWGVNVIVVRKGTPSGWEYTDDWFSLVQDHDHRHGPQVPNLLFQGRTIIIKREGLTHETVAEATMHELAHIVVGDDPQTSDEEGAIMGVEVEAHIRLKLDWKTWMNSYEGWHRWPATQRRDTVAGAKDKAIKAGLLDKRGKPTYRMVPVTPPPSGFGRSTPRPMWEAA